MPHQIALNKAKIALMSHPNSTFFTTVCFSLKHVWDDTIPTACTNGVEIRFNPASYLALTPGQRVSRLMHETLHVALQHMGRLQGRCPDRWNKAADFCINLMLVERGFERIQTWLYDEQYQGMSTEQIYDLLPEGEPMPQDQKDLEAPPMDPEEFIDNISNILVRASIQSKMAGDAAGSIPGEIEIYLEKLLKPRLPWNRILQKYLTSLAKNDYSFRKANRRYFPTHHLPSLYSSKLMDIAIAVDTSGSVSDEDFTVFITEVDSILRMMQPDKITLVQFDTKIKSIDQVKNVKDLSKLSFTGRGGTDITPVMAWAKETKPQLLLLFSDGHFKHHPSHNIKAPMLWIIHNNDQFTAPYGKVIHYKI